VRSISVKLDRPSFTLNPTSCDPMAFTGTTTSTFGQSAALSSPFQVGGCSSLGFSPKLGIELKGATKRTGHPALTATATFTQGQANTKFVQVTLPHAELLDQSHIKTICTRVQFAANACPVGSVYGSATATSSLLDKPLSGPVYLRSSSHALPDLVVALKGQIDVALVGRVDSINGGIRTTFEEVPDAPVSKFVLKMKGGKKSLLVNSTNTCAKPQRAVLNIGGQNGKKVKNNKFKLNVASCKKAKKKSHK